MGLVLILWLLWIVVLHASFSGVLALTVLGLAVALTWVKRAYMRWETRKFVFIALDILFWLAWYLVDDRNSTVLFIAVAGALYIIYKQWGSALVKVFNVIRGEHNIKTLLMLPIAGLALVFYLVYGKTVSLYALEGLILGGIVLWVFLRWIGVMFQPGEALIVVAVLIIAGGGLFKIVPGFNGLLNTGRTHTSSAATASASNGAPRGANAASVKAEILKANSVLTTCSGKRQSCVGDIPKGVVYRDTGSGFVVSKRADNGILFALSNAGRQVSTSCNLSRGHGDSGCARIGKTENGRWTS